jgi:ribonucleoside-diphosphate reductase alpha chain
MYTKKIEDLTDEEIAKVIKRSPYNKSTANEIDRHIKVKMQGIIQQYISHSISVTHK